MMIYSVLRWHTRKYNILIHAHVHVGFSYITNLNSPRFIYFFEYERSNSCWCSDKIPIEIPGKNVQIASWVPRIVFSLVEILFLKPLVSTASLRPAAVASPIWFWFVVEHIKPHCIFFHVSCTSSRKTFDIKFAASRKARFCDLVWCTNGCRGPRVTKHFPQGNMPNILIILIYINFRSMFPNQDTTTVFCTGSWPLKVKMDTGRKILKIISGCYKSPAELKSWWPLRYLILSVKDLK